MRPAEKRADYYLVPILENGRPVSEFEMAPRSGSWAVVSQLAEHRPAGIFYDIEQGQARLRKELGPRTQTRIALFLPSGLVFIVGHHGSDEATVYLAWESHGPGLIGFKTFFPKVGTLYSPDALRGILSPGP